MHDPVINDALTLFALGLSLLLINQKFLNLNDILFSSSLPSEQFYMWAAKQAEEICSLGPAGQSKS